jgi:thymidylate kinase
MIIFLEGLNGAGKTAYAKALSKKLGWPMYRAFRKGKEKHDFELNEKLKSWGCQPNTHVEDIHIADLLSTFEINGVMERTYISALAYDHVYKTERAKNSAAAFPYWLEQIRQFDFLYVWLDVSYETSCDRRTGFQPSKKDFNALRFSYEKAFHMMPKKKMRIDTETVSVKDGVKRICRRLKNS